MPLNWTESKFIHTVHDYFHCFFLLFLLRYSSILLCVLPSSRVQTLNTFCPLQTFCTDSNYPMLQMYFPAFWIYMNFILIYFLAQVLCILFWYIYLKEYFVTGYILLDLRPSLVTTSVQLTEYELLVIEWSTLYFQYETTTTN